MFQVLALVLGFFLALGVSASAAAAAGGTVVGRVQNTLTGNYLNNARVSVVGTNIEVFTNQFGEYTINDAPAGDAKLKVFFTGLEQQTVEVFIPEGQVVLQDFSLKSLNQGDDVIALDEFVVASNRETNAQAIAQNEQRFSANIKNVVDSGAFGDVTEGNVGEFVKYLPGVTVDYVAADVRTMSVRGFADNFTTISVDGGRMASASSGNAQRAFEFEQVSLNNVSRVEVVKVPTPDLPADSLGGAVNMVSKSAFERDRAKLTYKTYLNFNSEDAQVLQKTPGPSDKATQKVLPGFDFDYTLPVSKKFGIVITGLSSNQFNEQHRTQPQWNYVAAGTGASVANPFLQSYQMQDGPKNTWRQSSSVRADWKVAPNQVLSATLQWNHYQSAFGNRNITWNAGTAKAATAVGVGLTFDPTATNGASGQGSVSQGTSFRDKLGATVAGTLKYTYTGREWNVEAGFNASRSKTWYRDTANGHWNNVGATLVDTNGSTSTSTTNVSRVQFAQFNGLRPMSIIAINSAGVVRDWNLLSNYAVTTANTQPVDGSDEFKTGYINVKRDLNLSIPLSIKFGVDQRRQTRDIRKLNETWNYLGATGTSTAADRVATPFMDTRYSGQDSYWGFGGGLQWIDPYALFTQFKSSPQLFNQTITQLNSALQFKLRNSLVLEEKVSSAYAQLDGKLLNGRLRVVTGVRFEKTEDEGAGAYTPPWNKTLYGTSRNYQYTYMLQNWVERGLKVGDKYDGFYPSFHLTYSINDNLIARFAYAKTLGRPDFGNIVPQIRINDNPSDTGNDDLGDIPIKTIVANNPALKPWEGDNYDLTLEYYIPSGGGLSFGVFKKNLTGFFATTTAKITTEELDALSLGDEYSDFFLTTTRNGGEATIKGVEFDYQQPLKFLPWKFKHLNFRLNGTRLFLNGEKTADFKKFVKESGNVSLTYNGAPFTLMLKLNYRGRQKLDPQTSTSFYNTSTVDNQFYQYYSPRLNLDVNAEYMLKKNFSIFANARNVTNVSQDLINENGLNPGYASNFRVEEYGVQISLGVKGSF